MAKIEAGKWYKNRQWGRPTRDFAKAITATSECIQFSEKIHDGEFIQKTDWWGAVETCVEASPEDYMHFLPDGHPDKNSIIVGAWYRHPAWASNDFVKIKRIGSDSIFFSEKIDGGHYSNKDGEWGTGSTSPKQCVKADLSEYTGYLPDGHPDKSLKDTSPVDEPWQTYSGRYAKDDGKIYLLGRGARNGMYQCLDESGKTVELDVHYSGVSDRLKVELMPKGWSLPKFSFEVGKWYKNVGSVNQFYVKFLRMEGSSMYGESIDMSSHNQYDKESMVTQYHDSAILMTDLSEIQKYLPEGHVDKIKPKHSFVVGKWYVSSRWINFKAARFLKISRYGQFTYSETIKTDGKHEVHENTTGTDNQIWESFSEVDIKDIQDNLPIGHTDKKTNIIAGKWYKNSGWNHRNDYCKAIRLSGSGIDFSEKIYYGEYEKKEGYWGAANTCVEASPEEYSEYLPDGHPEKIIKLQRGKWYSCLAHGRTWYYKFNEINEFNAITVSEYISDSGNYHKGFGNFNRLGEYDVRLLTDLTVIERYLPEGHVDKISKIITNGTYGSYGSFTGGWVGFVPKEDSGELKLIKSKKMEIKLVN